MFDPEVKIKRSIYLNLKVTLLSKTGRKYLNLTENYVLDFLKKSRV